MANDINCHEDDDCTENMANMAKHGKLGKVREGIQNLLVESADEPALFDSTAEPTTETPEPATDVSPSGAEPSTKTPDDLLRALGTINFWRTSPHLANENSVGLINELITDSRAPL
jgi:hypothetical protein